MQERTEPSVSDSLQMRFAPQSRCFGCGPRNEAGLHLLSYAEDRLVVANWVPDRRHESFDNILNGGICSTLLDCQATWAAAWHLYQQRELQAWPCVVTASLRLVFLRPTRTDRPVRLEARATASKGGQVTIEATLQVEDRATVTCSGSFVAVAPGHPAYHRW